MGGESQKWIVLVATTWIQAFTGTNLDFSSYSTDLKSILGVSQVQLNYIGVASDMGKAFGWCSGVALLHFPTWIVLFAAAFMGFLGYGLQWLLIEGIVSLPYSTVLLLSLLAGCSISWFNTVCYVLCIKYFPENRGLALSLSISYNGVSAALYNLIANSIDPSDSKLYLLLNAIVPLVTSVVSLPPIFHHSPSEVTPPDNPPHRDSAIFLILTSLATITGLHLLMNSKSSTASTARMALAGAIFMLVLPLVILGMIYLWEMPRKTINPSFQQLQGSGFTLMDNEDDEDDSHSSYNDTSDSDLIEDDFYRQLCRDDDSVGLGDDHTISLLIRQFDFWLYYLAYFCGGTIGLVYSNNLGQISESLGYSKYTNSLVALYSASSFFGRLLSTIPDFLQDKVYFARTLWLTLAIIPTSAAFLLLVLSAGTATLGLATSLIGLSSGFVFSAAVSITSELFGPNRAGVNHNILITNIPIGSLLYSLLAAVIYEANIETPDKVALSSESKVCIGEDCYHRTFMWWWLISLLGLLSSSWFSIRTKAAYDRFERQKRRSKVMLLRSIHS
ncbi:protein NUCLEAR FUSION DEFECTIVE 4-like [Andrographis paniculata]|uniref:protein NUCLEAR FUSION DEFECTIVE 4-like n=1 Tax=Andrographis paniculata TaxID=175694 RepID=UPI0021E97BD1|nr:protein NUCLEAR FUSION DEFECTIVE 4-like [Andrographis paniculata]